MIPKKTGGFSRRTNRHHDSITKSSSGSSAAEAEEGPAADVHVNGAVSNSKLAMCDPSAQLATAVAARANQYTNECLFGAASGEGASPFSPGVLDPETWDSISQYSKSDLVVGKHLGMGSFSDVFEVIAPQQQTRRLRHCQGNTTTFSLTSVCEATPICKNQTIYAMKCLRPKIQSDVEQFLIGIEDLIHETAILANLDHPHVIKLHGRAASSGSTTEESVAGAFRLSDGYFLLLDRLEETLDDRLDVWRTAAVGGGRGAAPTPNRLAVAVAVADALAYLHSAGVVYRDLKSANVGFDAHGVPKLFDFGFAVAVRDGVRLRGTCGTPRYMAPEVGLGREYGTAADVHSFGVLLWEICSLEMAFARVASREEMRRTVYEGGCRPRLARRWPAVLKNAMRGCWCREPEKRPTMDAVSTLLKAHVKRVQQQNKRGSLGNSSLLRRLRGVKTVKTDAQF